MVTATLAQQLQSSAVSFKELHSNYHPMLELVRELIGVVPNCDPFLEIWPTGFRTYNLLVPNALNLPFSLWGMGAPKAQIGLAMYSASRTADCAYCSAHTCSFALRRGASSAALVGDRKPHEAAVVAVAEAMSRIPSDLTRNHVTELTRHFSSADIEWIVLAVGMMGFLNKFMDAVGVELEAEAIADVGALLTPTGWNPGKHGDAMVKMPTAFAEPPIDSLRTYLRVMRQAGGALIMERRWTRGVPDRWPEAGAFLEAHTGHNFPLLSKLCHKRAIRTIATTLRDNLDPAASEIGLATKSLIGLVYATVAGNLTLAQEAKLLATQFSPELDESTLDVVCQFAKHAKLENAASNREFLEELSSLPTLSRKDAACIMLARAASTSPAKITPAILTEVSPLLDPASIIELMVWLSVQQMLHRLICFYAVADKA